MKTEPDKKNHIPYTITVTTQFVVYMTKKDEDEGVEILQELIQQETMKNIENGEYDVQEDSME